MVALTWLNRALAVLGSPPQKLVTFLPAFWLLVPGATGLIGVTEIVGKGLNAESRALTDVLVAIISISLGVLVGAAAFAPPVPDSAVCGGHYR